MAKGNDKNYVSFWFWMFVLFIAALPCIGFIMIVIWAFVGDNESRKNYFRAIIVWFFIVAALWVGIMALGFWPEIQKQVQSWMHQIH
jgi:uncharacterized membrane protein YqjE